MNVNTYVPDALGARAKAAALPLSRLLRREIERELADRDAAAAVGLTAYTLDLGDRLLSFIGERVARDERRAVSAYRNSDGRLVIYDSAARRAQVLDGGQDREGALRDALGETDEFVRACGALGIKPRVRI